MFINRSYLKRILLGGCLAASLFAFDRPVQAVVILDSTWQSEGGPGQRRRILGRGLGDVDRQ